MIVYHVLKIKKYTKQITNTIQNDKETRSYKIAETKLRIYEKKILRKVPQN